jgi:hypothetical protein
VTTPPSDIAAKNATPLLGMVSCAFGADRWAASGITGDARTMTPADCGAVMRYADELADFRVIPIKALAVLQRLVFRYRRKGGRVACVDLAELAGDGLCKTTLCKLLDALERARLLIRERWGVVRNGRWKQMPNRYHLRTAEEAKRAAIEAAAGGEPEPERVFFTVSLPVSESNFCTVLRVIEEDPSLIDSELSASPESKIADGGSGIPAEGSAPETVPADGDATPAVEAARPVTTEGRALQSGIGRVRGVWRRFGGGSAPSLVDRGGAADDAVTARAGLAKVAADREAQRVAAWFAKRLNKGVVALA